jgi:hypothetical protein
MTNIFDRFVMAGWNMQINHKKSGIEIWVIKEGKAFMAEGRTLNEAKEDLELMNRAELAIPEQV